MNRSGSNTRSLTEGALLAALSVVLVLAGQFLPLMGPLITVLWPVPVIVVVIRHGMRTGVLTVLTAGLLLSMIVGLVQGVIIALTLGAAGLVLGAGFRGRWPAGRMVLAGGTGMVLVMVMNLLAARYLLAIDLLEIGLEAMRQGLDISVSLYSGLGVPQAQLDLFESLVGQAVDLVPVLFPAGIVGGAIVVTYVNLVVARGILGRLSFQVPDMPPFATWTVPTYLLVVYALAIGALYMVPEGPLFNAGYNAFMLMTMVFLVQGTAVAYYFLRRIGTPAFLGVAAIVITATPLSNLYVLAGIVEAGFGFRERAESRSRERSREPDPGRRQDDE